MPSCCWPVRRLMPCINHFFFPSSSSIPSWQILFIDLTGKGEIAFQEILSHLVEQQTNKYLCQNIASSTCIFLAGRSTSSASLRCAHHVIAAAPQSFFPGPWGKVKFLECPSSAVCPRLWVQGRVTSQGLRDVIWWTLDFD